jgi:hypothetical protein
MSIGGIKQCRSLTKNNCQCKNHAPIDSDYCKIHSKKEVVLINTPTIPTNVPIIPFNITININPTNISSNITGSTITNSNIASQISKEVMKDDRQLCSCLTKKGNLCSFPSVKEYNGKLLCLRHLNAQIKAESPQIINPEEFLNLKI